MGGTGPLEVAGGHSLFPTGPASASLASPSLSPGLTGDRDQGPVAGPTQASAPCPALRPQAQPGLLGRAPTSPSGRLVQREGKVGLSVLRLQASGS